MQKIWVHWTAKSQEFVGNTEFCIRNIIYVFLVCFNWQCSRSCGSHGVKLRSIECVFAKSLKLAKGQCQWRKKPPLQEPCNRKPCIQGEFSFPVSLYEINNNNNNNEQKRRIQEWRTIGCLELSKCVQWAAFLNVLFLWLEYWGKVEVDCRSLDLCGAEWARKSHLSSDWSRSVYLFSVATESPTVSRFCFCWWEFWGWEATSFPGPALSLKSQRRGPGNEV